MSTALEFAASSVGAVAFSVAQQPHAARVVGVTSRGLFLLSTPQQIVFVSFERCRSPLTINLDRSVGQLRSIEHGTPATFSDSRLVFPSIEFSIFLSVDVVWRCPSPNLAARSHAEQMRTLQAIASGVLARGRHNGLGTLLPRLLDLPDAAPLSGEYSALLERLIALRCAMQTSDSCSTVAGLTGLLGQGRGLTPSGDDVVIGLLLTLNRWHTDRDWMAVRRALVEVAYQRTTTISANLIESAASGQGDERLIAVVDGIASGRASIDTCVDYVLDWGSSSGIDALVGMAVVVTAF